MLYEVITKKYDLSDVDELVFTTKLYKELFSESNCSDIENTNCDRASEAFLFKITFIYRFMETKNRNKIKINSTA